MRVLTATSLYPNPQQPTRGLFVAERMQRLALTYDIDLRVIAPKPVARWPSGQIEKTDTTFASCSTTTWHPEYLAIPKTGMYAAPYMMRRAVMRAYRDLSGLGWVPDLIDGHYLYPDGVAAAYLARQINRPLVLSARGTDANLLPEYPVLRSAIRRVCAQASYVVCVSNAIKLRLIALGIAEEKLAVIPNGVDREKFKTNDRVHARAELGYQGLALLCVGNLVPEKAHCDAIEALAELEDATLTIVGEGPLRDQLELQAERLDVSNRVKLLGSVSNDELPLHYAAADVLVHPSLREGMPNVVLEALACGLPVVASRVGALPELVDEGRTGFLVSSRSPSLVAEAIRQIQLGKIDRAAVAQSANRFDWEDSLKRQYQLYCDAASQLSAEFTSSSHRAEETV